jgi:hypothetical protein
MFRQTTKPDGSDGGNKMKCKASVKSAVDIADAIVDLVERNKGPVLLTQVEREIPGFATKDPLSWCKTINDNDRELLIWHGMTEAGAAALGSVIFGARLAIQPIDVRPYFLEGRVIEDENWWPIVLLPASAANLRAPNNLLIRFSENFLDYYVRQAEAEGISGYRLLTPGSAHYTTDYFSH